MAICRLGGLAVVELHLVGALVLVEAILLVVGIVSEPLVVILVHILELVLVQVAGNVGGPGRRLRLLLIWRVQLHLLKLLGLLVIQGKLVLRPLGIQLEALLRIEIEVIISHLRNDLILLSFVIHLLSGVNRLVHHAATLDLEELIFFRLRHPQILLGRVVVVELGCFRLVVYEVRPGRQLDRLLQVLVLQYAFLLRRGDLLVVSL